MVRSHVLRWSFIGAIAVLAAVIGPAAGVPSSAVAASGCADIDGDGVVHAMDMTYLAAYFAGTVPPAPPQVDLTKDGSISGGDIGSMFSQFDTVTSCQTSPLPKTTMSGGGLVVDANGENAYASDETVEVSRYVLLGSGSFHISVRLTTNPGIVGYQVRLHWDEGVLDLNPRTASENNVWVPNVSPSPESLQVQGPPDDGAGNDAYIELVTAPLKKPESSLLVVPLAQFAFTCQAAGTATIDLSDPGNHTNLVDYPPATEYAPTLTSAQIVCLTPGSDDDQDGCTNAQELGPNERLGGRRDPLSHWDFIDQWIGGAKDRAISGGDIAASVARFGQLRPGGTPTKQEALAEALTPPTNQHGYHASADRNGAIPPEPWDLLPPNGSISAGDHVAVVQSYGHSCM
jgi:hypothetical protein